MALSYELGEIADWKPLAEEYPGTVEIMCFASMFIGMPIIAEGGKDDWREFYKRIHMWEKAYGCLGNGEDGEPSPVSPKMVRRFVGLKTNASRMTPRQFALHLAEGMRSRANEELMRWQRQEGLAP